MVFVNKDLIKDLMNEKVVETEGSFRKQRNEKGCLGRKQCSGNK